MIRTSYTIGKRNRNVSALYKRYCCQDHLFPNNRYIPQKKNSEIQLAVALEIFNSFINQKMNIEPHTSYLKDYDLNGGREFISSEKMLYRQLIAGEETRDVVIDVGPDDRQVYLCRNHITELNENIAHLSTITVMQTCCNYIRYLPSEIGCLVNLKMLILSRNRLKTLPPEVGYCKELREIDVSFNLLRTLPKSIITLRNLHTLHLEANRFKELPSFLGKLHTLKFLTLGYNEITHIPLEIFKLPFLLSLNADECHFDYTNTKFEEVVNMELREVLCRKMVIENIRIDRNTPKLITNQIVKVRECAFCGGPYIDSYVEIEDFYTFESEVYPVKYRMCCKHYNDHRERIPALFETPIDTVPIQLQEDGISSITEMFEPMCLSNNQKRNISRIRNTNTRTIPLYFLADKEIDKDGDECPDSFLDRNIIDINVFDGEMFEETDY